MEENKIKQDSQKVRIESLSWRRLLNICEEINKIEPVYNIKWLSQRGKTINRICESYYYARINRLSEKEIVLIKKRYNSFTNKYHLLLSCTSIFSTFLVCCRYYPQALLDKKLAMEFKQNNI